MRTGHAGATFVAALVFVACTRSAQAPEPPAPSARAARVNRAAVWRRPPAIGCDAELVALDPAHPWDFGSVEDGITGHGTYPFATFRLVTPARHSGRTVNVVYACDTDKRLSPPLGRGMGHTYRLELPEDFLEGRYATIEDCDFPGVAWVCPDQEPCPPPPSR
jgi:hypothetical protein